MSSVPWNHARDMDPNATAQRDHVTVLSYSGPVQRVGDDWVRAAGGLVTVLEPLLQRCKGLWVNASADEGDPPPSAAGGYRLCSVPLENEQRDGFFSRFANSVLRPALHGFPLLGQGDDDANFTDYEDVNRAFAEVTLEHVGADDLVWVHDYQLMRTPLLLKHTVPSLRVGWFCHVPWPTPDHFEGLPWRTELLEGVLGADVVGFHCARYVENFLSSAALFVDATVDFDDWTVRGPRGLTRAIVAPVGIRTGEVATLLSSPAVRERARLLEESVGRRRILLGVDRLDHTKGIAERLRAFARLLEQQPALRDQLVFIQVVVPNRESILPYASLKETLERLVGEINGKQGTPEHLPIRYVYGSLDPEELYAHYQAADVAVVTPLRDGMNLVALEYVAARQDEGGALVLSESTGSAQHLADAYLVNPHDIEAVAATLAKALADPGTERQRRMRGLRAAVANLDVDAWADAFLTCLHSVPQSQR